MKICTKSVLCISVFCLGLYSPNIFSQDDLITENSTLSIPYVKFLYKGNTKSLCLKDFNSQGDSCTDLQIFFKNLGIKLNFFCDKNHNWEYNGIGYSNRLSQKIPANISLITDSGEKLSHARIVFGRNSDTSNLWIDPFRDRDIPIIPDSTKPLDYDLNLSRFICMEKPKLIVDTDREFTYPAGFRRKEPILNYPELSAFHWGSSVKIPPTASILKRGYEIVECHILHASEMEYDDPELIRKREILFAKWEKRHPPKPKKKRTKPPLLSFKPL